MTERSGLGGQSSTHAHVTTVRCSRQEETVAMESSSSAEEGRGSCFSNEGTAEPRIEDMISRINELQQAKKIANKELCETQAHRQSLQKQLDELSLEETQLKEILSKKQETLRMLHLQCQEKETEALRKQAVSEGCKKRINELSSKIQEEKLKKRNQRMEFGQQLEEMVEKHKTLWEFHKVDKLSQEMSNINNNKEQLLMEERLTLKKLESIQKQLDRLTPPEAKTEAVAVTSIDAFLCSEEAAAAVQLFEEENKKATEFLEAASLRYHQLQQKYQRLKRELEAVGHCAIGGSKERSPEEAAEGEGGIATNVGERETVMEIPRMQKKDQEFRPGPGEHPSSLGPSSS
ncbi:synaptonemal complex central element protein 1-like [Dromiciops gliroides]|uniref:synaptonemal complex central element protein 1-like n=1 Tax=Dromiciops gliroides TaxID=33562 RepID=UPI001CC6172E|nr:synaptonemal complex central element protein 1-like [Dromiciops gliroides]XP_043830478.1 synaptonemal complex central element protein 1-like [Dromiciops gliroides]XP_043830479.1 synaptonemal complex central element protein 1-like [Dromiciops gliroides]